MAVTDFHGSGWGFGGARRRSAASTAFDRAGWEALEQARDRGEGAADDSRFRTASEGIVARLMRVTHYLGAVLSVGLMLGLAVWGWQLVTRDVSGVPVIRALAGDARVAPDEPGGEMAAHAGLAVNGVASGAPATPADRVALAPEPTGLAEDDVAMGDLGAVAREPAQGSVPMLRDDAIAALDMTDREAEAAAAAAAAALAAAAASTAPAADGPVTDVVTDAAGAPPADPVGMALAEAGATPGAAVSPLAASDRPLPRPRAARVAAAGAPSPAIAADADAAADSDADADAPAPAPAPPARSAAVASGAPLVQIGAFDSDGIAAREWDRIASRNGDLFAGKSPVIQRHDANGRTFWRLRVAGFDSSGAARRFCAALAAKGTDCLPTVAP